MDDSIAISIKDLSLSFSTKKRREDAHAVFQKLNLNIKKNSFVCILGPSGCGKSTLLRLMSELILPQQGSVAFNFEETKVTTNRSAFVFQKPTLLPWLSAIDNILFPIKHKFGRINAQDVERAHSLIELIKLSKFANGSFIDVRVAQKRSRVDEPVSVPWK
jgi:NitT/TauT family transport system ATP-binding protein